MDGFSTTFAAVTRLPIVFCSLIRPSMSLDAGTIGSLRRENRSNSFTGSNHIRWMSYPVNASRTSHGNSNVCYWPLCCEVGGASPYNTRRSTLFHTCPELMLAPSNSFEVLDSRWSHQPILSNDSRQSGRMSNWNPIGTP